MSQHADIVKQIQTCYRDLTKSERLVANRILAYPERFALESAAELATKAGVSSMTVSRFVRKLGYDDVSDIRKSARESVLGPDHTVRSIRDRYDVFSRTARGADERERSLEAEIAGLRAAFAIAAEPAWERAVEIIASSERVYVHGLQVTRGLATEFASRLEFVRPNVHLADGQNGTFAELIGDDPQRVCAVLIDIHRYARLTRALAERAADAGIPLIIVSDEYCHWAREFTENTFLVPTSTGLFWHSTAAMGALLNLIVSDVISRLGETAREHIDRVLDAQQFFGQFESAAR